MSTDRCRCGSKLDAHGRAVQPRKVPSLTTDAGVLRTATDGSGRLEVLMIRRGHDPFKGKLAFPGGFVEYGEEPSAGCLRELREETSLHGHSPKLVGAYGDPHRDPRKHVVSLLYNVCVDDFSGVQAADDARDAEFVDAETLLRERSAELAFDHAKLLADLLSFHAR
eukprot:TRINITY_DN15529_c0_g1_i1.p1 TRINITY_DN15529_c0_g1~~TRINITY_DN15529_c0_g1_i1.p1  ORF type:complete len:188 (+),score=49.89 TRINITY_DN15529_c0_g1_i1:64-564(+)